MEGYCLIVTWADLMRGIDYRISDDATMQKDIDGIDFLLATQCKHRRELLQAVSRVGRYNEPAGYFSLYYKDYMISVQHQVQNMGAFFGDLGHD